MPIRPEDRARGQIFRVGDVSDAPGITNGNEELRVMGETSDIGWTERTWNPWTGCEQVDPGCANCYMARWAERAGRDPWVLKRSTPATFNAPLSWARKGPARVFTCSLSDWFHKDADPFRAEAWEIIRKTPDLTYRIASHLPAGWGEGWPHVWLGVSGSEPEGVRRRLDALRAVPARTRFLSLEPLIAAVDLRGQLEGIHWVIVGGESGGRDSVRPVREAWLLDVVEACAAAGVACFVKQLGAVTIPLEGGVRLVPHSALAILRPALNVRQYPAEVAA